mgnify:FL=1
MSEPVSLEKLQEQAITTVKTVFDPEIPVDIWELGLIYELRFDLQRNLKVIMTLTSPNCPAAQSLPQEVKDKLQSIPGIGEVTVQIVWDPPWDKDMMSEVAKLELGFL